MSKLHLETVSDLLVSFLTQLMAAEEFSQFRLVGGTSLSLQLGHRESVDIDLFTDADYGSIDFKKLEDILDKLFPYVELPLVEEVGLGKSYYIGNDSSELIKLDLFYTDTFVFPCIHKQNFRLASIEEIAAMKIEVISQGGRKKDFWDLHELMDTFTLDMMFDFFLKRYPYGSSMEKLRTKVVDFSTAEDDFTPNCYRDKEWEIIKLDIEEMVQK